MEVLPGKQISLWKDTVTPPTYPVLGQAGEPAEAMTPDVVVIGGGIVGVTAAYALKKSGLKVCLIEARALGSGTTGHTTAKVTSLHGLIYARIARSFGDDHALLYGKANENALEWMASTVADLNIDCDFLRLPAFTFTADDSELARIEQEVEVAQRVGLPASFVSEIDLPVPVKGAVRFANQAQFHPLKYLYALAETIPGDGSAVFEHTRALDVDDGRICRVKTNHGELKTKHVIVATQSPFPFGGFYFARTYPESHPAIAYRAGASGHTEATLGAAVSGMYLGVKGSPHSVRMARIGGVDYLISDTPGYRTGHEDKVSDLLRGLIAECQAVFPGSTVAYHWEALDFMPADQIPYVGTLTGLTPNILVATGFRAWGITNGTAAALMLTDRIFGRKPEWMDVFDSNRKDLKQLATMGSQALTAVHHLVLPRIMKSQEKISDLKPGEWKIADVEGERVAVSRDRTGRLHGVKPSCKHMGCVVSWNDGAETWDCPCHGSRYLADGRMIGAPTTKDLEKVDLPET